MKMAQSSSKRLENAVGKREIACLEQFLLFHGCFQKLLLQTHKNKGLFEKCLTYNGSITSPGRAPILQTYKMVEMHS